MQHLSCLYFCIIHKNNLIAIKKKEKKKYACYDILIEMYIKYCMIHMLENFSFLHLNGLFLSVFIKFNIKFFLRNV